MVKAVILPDGALITDVNRIVMVTAVEEKKAKEPAGLFWNKIVSKFTYSVVVVITEDKVEEIEYEYDSIDDAIADRERIVSDILLALNEDQSVINY